MPRTQVGVWSSPTNLRDYWSSVDTSQPIIIREALALKNTLMAGASSLAASRVDAHVDSLPLVRTWTNQGGKSKALTDVVQAIYETSLQFNIALSLVYVPSKDNLADAPSRALSSSDCIPSLRAWMDIEKRWGLHSVDLMALPNTPLDAQGHTLNYFTLWPTQNSAGVNVFFPNSPSFRQRLRVSSIGLNRVFATILGLPALPVHHCCA